MIYEVIPPCEALKDLISHFWTGTWAGNSRMPNNTYYVIANSRAELTFAFGSNYRDGELLFSALQGHTQQPRSIQVDAFQHLIGVSFYPHAPPPFFQYRCYSAQQRLPPPR